MIGSSVLREFRDDDLLNGEVRCIRGGHVKDVKNQMGKLNFTPKTIITQIGGNDISKNENTVESVSEEYAELLSETKVRYPDAKVVVSGLPPRLETEEVRTKVKDFNETARKWCNENNLQFIDNESPFELKTGEADTSVYIMTGPTPGVHLNRRGTVRLMENIQKAVPHIKLNENRNDPISKMKTYAEALKVKKQPNNNYKQYENRQETWTDGNNKSLQSRGCGEKNHVLSQCKYSRKIRCYQCNVLGHKEKFCSA